MQDHTQALREALQGFLDFHTKPAGISVELITEKALFTQALADIGKREDDLIAAARAALSSNHEDGGRADASALAICASMLHELRMGAYRPEEVPAKIDLALKRAGLSSLDDVVALASPGPVWCSCGDGIMPDTGAKCGVCASGVALGGEKGEPPCSEHPDAPHGYNRNASHNAGRYVCDCEGWAAMGGEKGEAVAETENALRPDHPLAKGSCVHGESMAKHCAWCSARPVGKARMLTEAEADHITGMHNTGRSQGDSECAEAIQRKFCEVNGITLQGGA